MKRISFCKLAALLLCLILPLPLLSACVSLPPVPSLSVPRDSAAVTTPVTEAAPPVSSEAEPERDPGEGASLRKIFGDADLSQEQLLYADQLCFRLETEKDVRAQIMDLETLERRLEALGPLPRTRYYEQLLSEDYRLLFSAYDMALELGSAKFCFPTRSLRARDVSEIVELLNASYPLFDARPRFSVTRDLTDGSGEKYRFLTVCFTNCSPEKLREHHLAVEACRAILHSLPEQLREDPAQYPVNLYSAVVHSVHYDTESASELAEHSPLYLAILEKRATSYGISAWFYTLMNLAGYDCLLVSGTCFGGTEENPHAIYDHNWNIAKLADAYYVFDPTLDNWYSEDGYLFFYGLSEESANEKFPRTMDPYFTELVPPCPEDLTQDSAPIAPEIEGGTNLSHTTGAIQCLNY